MSATTAITQTLSTLKLQTQAEPEPTASTTQEDAKKEPEYAYAHLLPTFVPDHYPPLTPFEHVDPGSRALSHPNPRAFLDKATSVFEITPKLGTEVTGVNLAELDGNERDQLALEVRRQSGIAIIVQRRVND